MTKRCAACDGKLGLGVKSKALWESSRWCYVLYRFCSAACQHAFLQARQAAIDRQRAVQQLYHPP